MTAPRAVVLVGPRGAGKTTVGRALARALGWGFCDADEALAERVGEPAGAFLQRAGEAAFRAVEAEVTTALLARADREVLALGGGAVTTPAIRRALADAGLHVVLLVAPAAVLGARLAASGILRPPLTGLAPDREIEALLAQRMPLYAAVADATVDTGARSVDEVAAALAAALTHGS